MPIPLKVVQTGLEQSIDAAAKRAGKNLRINMGPGAKSIESLSKPLGRLTGKADEFTKSMEAANARVLAFGASVGVISAVTKGFKDLVTTTIQVEKSLANINSILQQNDAQLSKFKDNIFNVAKNTEQTFENVAEAALELSRQGLKAEEITKRLNDALILSRLSGLSAADAVAGLTAAINSFSSAGLTSAEVLNKISAAAASAAVSDRDLIEGLKRSGSVAVTTGVQFDELVGIIGALQEKTARGGAVIGNSLKTIFTRIQDLDKLKALQNLGVEVTDFNGKVLASNKIIENLAPTFAKLDQASKVSLADNLVGKFQIAPFLALLEDYNQQLSRSGEIANTSLGATNEAYKRNEALNLTLSAAINKAVVSLKELGNTLGEIGVTDNLKNIVSFFNTVVGSIEGVLDGDGLGSKFAKGLVKGIGNIISGPGLALALAAIGKLLFDFAKFGAGALKTFFGLNRAAEAQATLQGQIAASLLNDKGIRQAILDIDKRNISQGEKKKLQIDYFTTALREQMGIMKKMQGIATTIAPSVLANTTPKKGKRAAGGFLPIGAERSDIARGVGGAPSSAKPVIIPNFAFGGGQRGTMVANDSEYIVPNYANGGDAIFNQNMASSMGLPANARKVRAASGFIPNFSALDAFRRAGKLNKKHTRSDFFVRDEPRTDIIRDVINKHPNSAEAKQLLALKNREKDKGKRSYMANKDPNKSIMLIPQRERFQLNGADHHFTKPYKSVLNDTIDFFEGPTAGISKKLKSQNSEGNRFRKLLTLDTDIEQALAKGINGIFSKFKQKAGGKNAFKTQPNKVTASNIKDIMERGGSGALGAIKGATFEALIQAIVGGVSQDPNAKGEGGQLDVDFSKDTDGILDVIFGIQGKNFKFGDFKSSASSGNKTKYAKQVVNNVKGKVIVGAKAKIANSKTAASGYIPNFAEGALEEAIGREKAAGLPISQIRVNQSGKLRNSQNPMGLAVTNTRDEPTGAIPNYAKGGGTNPNQGMGDMLSKLFAVQMGFSGLSAVLGEVTEKNELVAGSLTMLNTVISGIMTAQAFGGFGAISSKGSSIMGKGLSNIAFAGSDLAGAGRGGIRGLAAGGGRLAARGGATAFMGILKTAGGALLKFTPHIAAATVAFMAINKIINWSAGTTKTLAKNQEALSEASKKAAKELSELSFSSQEKKEKFQATNEAFANEFKGKLNNIGFAGTVDEKQAQGLSDLVKQVYDMGGTKKDVDAALAAAKRSAGTRTISVGGQGGYAASYDVQNVLGAKDVDVLRKRLMALTDIDYSKLQQEFISKISDKDRATLAAGGKEAKEVRKRLMEQGAAGVGEDVGPHGEKRNKVGISSELIDNAIDEAERIGKEVKDKIQRMNTDTAKSILKTELNILKIKAKAVTEDEKKLSLAKITKTLTDSQILNLESTIGLNKLDMDHNVALLDMLEKRVDSIDKLNLDGQKQNDLQKALQGLTAEALNDEEKFLALMGDVLGLAEKIPDEQKSILKHIQQQTIKLRKETDARKDNLKLSQQQKVNELEISTIISNRIANLERAQQGRNLDLDFDMSSRKSKLANEKAMFFARNPNLTEEQRAKAEQRFTRREGAISIEEAEKKAVEETKKEVVSLSKELGEKFTPVLKNLLNILNEKGYSGISEVGTTIQGIATGEVNQVGVLDPDNPFTRYLDNARTYSDSGVNLMFDFQNVVREQEHNVKLTKQQVGEQNELAEATVKSTGNFKTFANILEAFVKNLREQAEQLRFDSLGTQDASSMISNLDQRILNARIMGDPTAGGISRANTIAGKEQMDRQILMAGSRGERNQLGREREVLVRQLALKEQIRAIDAQAPDAEERLLKIRGKLLALEKERSQLQKTRTLKQRLEDRKLDPIDIQDQFLTRLEDASVTFKDNFVSAFAEGIQSVDSLKDSLLNAANQFLQTMTKAFVQKWMDGASSSEGGLLGALFGSKKKASGGYISGGSGNKDDVPAMLMGGEFVMNKKAVQKYGMGFMSALNSGSIQGFARGGQVRDREGMFSTPGMNGAGPIVGGRNLMAFATQSPFALTRDTFTGNGAFLDAESGRMTMFGRRNNPQFQRVQDAKRSAFDLAIREEEAKAQAREQRVSLGSMLASAAISTIVGYGIANTVGGDVGKLLGSGIGNMAGTAITGAPSSGGALGAAATDPEAMQSVSDLFSKIPGVGRYFKTSATGGLIPSAGGTDTVPTMLSGGEFVMNAAATRNIGAGNLQALNSGAGTGDNSDLVAKLDELIRTTESSKSTGEINITINGSNGTETQTAGQETTEDQRALSERIKVAVKQVIADEKRLGGQLRR